MSPREPKKPGELITIRIEGVDPAIWHGFKKTCELDRRGEIISQLMEKYVRECWKAPPLESDPNLRNTAHAFIEGYRRWQIQAHEESEITQPDDLEDQAEQGPSPSL